MYGGLFGDLPAAKGESSSNNADGDANNANQSNNANNTPSASQLPPSKTTRHSDSNVNTNIDEKSVKSKASANAMFLPPALKKQKISTLSQTMGTAGTSMAFVPATVKRRKSRFAKILEAPEEAPPAAKEAVDVPLKSTKTSTLSPFIATTTVQTSSDAAPKGPIDIHASQEKAKEQISPSNENLHSNRQLQQESTDPSSSRSHSQDVSSAIIMEDDEDHEVEITDPYDPYVPNDLLQYLDRQTLIQEQKKMEYETKEALLRQKLLREQLEKEREELQKEGNLAKLEIAGAGRGRGRGRGISNLPAWLVAKRQEEQNQLGS